MAYPNRQNEGSGFAGNGFCSRGYDPHQVEAACFALKSPLEKGVLLADEVGLGKTIEASLMMAQKWAEHKRRILLVVPASLRKQWAQELQDKFELPSIVIDSKIAKTLKKMVAQIPLIKKTKSLFAPTNM